MLTNTQIDRLCNKFQDIERIYSTLMYEKVGELDCDIYETTDRLTTPPGNDVAWRKISTGDNWGGYWVNGWIRAKLRVDEDLEGKLLYLHSRMEAYESLLFINGVPSGNLLSEEMPLEGNYFSAPVHINKNAGTEAEIMIEAYSGHPIVGENPYENYDAWPQPDNKKTFNSIDVMIMRKDVQKFVFDLRTLNQLYEILPKDSFRRAEVANCLMEIFPLVVQYPAERPVAEWRGNLVEIDKIIAPVLAVQNGPEAPKATIIGHAHIDTAWKWPIEEGMRKSARCFSHVDNMMELYPEYMFLQVGVLHLDWMKEHYPPVFEKIKKRVAEGRFETNGGSWVEFDCMISSGESIVRQFLYGQRFTEENFGYKCNSFFLLDTFGFSPSLPQIMQGCDIPYFQTHKLSWSDANKFPFDTFKWKGIDGTSAFYHSAVLHINADPKTLTEFFDEIECKTVLDERFITFGFSTGGGSPSVEMIEMAKRSKDTNGSPKAEYGKIKDFMPRIEEKSKNVPVYNGELYLELHRGTTTSQHQIKRNNRKAEFALRDMEILNSIVAVKQDEAKNVRQDEFWKTLMINQMHDILPGSSNPEVHARSRKDMGQLIEDVSEEIGFYGRMLTEENNGVTLLNTLSWDRTGQVVVEGERAFLGKECQTYTDLNGQKKTAVGSVEIPSMGNVFLQTGDSVGNESPFSIDGNVIVTPFATITMDDNGYIESFIDKKTRRELRDGQYPLNAFLLAEDVPYEFDNWDIDADISLKYELVPDLKSTEIVSEGPLQLRIRSTWDIGQSSTITQDMVLYCDSPKVDFETVMDWKEKHHLLKTAFETSLCADSARSEIQFGHVTRPTTNNSYIELSQFEVCNHKWTDLSEGKFGIAVLNDCKYGLSTKEAAMYLTLHKAGTHPDYSGDTGRHEATYSFLPHDGGFSTESVIRPAYELNVMPIEVEGTVKNDSSVIVDVDEPNVIIETVKLAEDEKALMVRLYECERSSAITNLKLGFDVKKAVVTNMLEEFQSDLVVEDNGIELTFRPFEIKSIMLYY